jgi:hypothetical protein
MNNQNYRKAMAIEAKNKKRILEINPHVDDGSGIYFLTRMDEDGIRYAYIGQAKHLLTRLAQHLSGYQHIDLSLRKHGLYTTDNIYGWKIGFMWFPIEQLDEMEQKYIRQYAQSGYQLRNKTAGGQGEGKKQIAEYRPGKGYRDGLAQGKINLARELANIADKHLAISLKPEKQNNSVSKRQFVRFMELLHGEKDGSSDEES